MRGIWRILLAPGILAVMAIVLVVLLFLVKVLWVWTIPDLFPGAVEKELIARDISWLTALKMSIFLTVIASLTGMRSHSSKAVK